jgi:hypothetical protein
MGQWIDPAACLRLLFERFFCKLLHLLVHCCRSALAPAFAISLVLESTLLRARDQFYSGSLAGARSDVLFFWASHPQVSDSRAHHNCSAFASAYLYHSGVRSSWRLL